MVKITKDFHDGVRRCIPSEFNMISAADDSQEAQEAYNTSKFELPNPNGKEGGACTSAFLQVCYDNAYKMGKITWVQVLKQMRGAIKEMGLGDQEPQLTSSRMIDVNKPMVLVPPGSGRRRALLIGINYVGQGSGELRAPHNDTRNLKDYLVNVCGFAEKECLVLMDDGKHKMPTRKNIEDAFERLVTYSQPGDVCFVSFSGHGGQVEDTDGDESDGYDESLIPVDFKTSGQIVDDDILKNFIKPMSEGGTVADLPYKFGADDTDYQIEQCFNMETADEMKAREAKERAEEIKDRKARGEFVVDDTKPQKDYHPEPLPYNPEHGFIIRPAVKDPDEDSGIPVANAEEGEEEKEVDNGNNNNEGKRSGKQKKDDSKKKKKDSKKKKTKNKDAPPPPPPQCAVM